MQAHVVKSRQSALIVQYFCFERTDVDNGSKRIEPEALEILFDA